MTTRVYSLSKWTPDPEGCVVFDVRHLQNPHRDPTLRQFTGQDSRVREQVLASEGAKEVLQSAINAAVYGASCIAFRCTGGKHRSVALAEELAEHIRNILKIQVEVRHLAREEASLHQEWKRRDVG